MTEDQLRDKILGNFNLRIGPNMTRLVQQQFTAQPRPEEIAVMGGDARTGIARQQTISLSSLSSPATM